MGVLTNPVVPITTAVWEPLGGRYQFWTIENPDSNSNAIYVNPTTPATAVATQSKIVRPGQTAYLFVNAIENPNGVSWIAATGATTVNVLKESFRSRLGYQIAVLAAGVAASVANLWRVVAGSSTAVELNGAYTQARADTFDAKTAASGVRLGASLPSGGVGVGSAALIASNVVLGVGTDAELRLASSSITGRTANVTRIGVDATSGLAVHNAGPFSFFSGTATDPRHTLTSTALAIHTPVAGGSINSGFTTRKVPIANAAVVVDADILISSGNNRVKTTTAITDVAVIGQAVGGGTGNAGGTVMVEVIEAAFLIGTVVTGTTGTTAGQYIILATTAGEVNKVGSSTTRTNASFGRATSTASGGAVADYIATSVT